MSNALRPVLQYKEERCHSVLKLGFICRALSLKTCSKKIEIKRKFFHLQIIFIKKFSSFFAGDFRYAKFTLSSFLPTYKVVLKLLQLGVRNNNVKEKFLAVVFIRFAIRDRSVLVNPLHLLAAVWHSHCKLHAVCDA